jgi:hypothetical protein
VRVFACVYVCASAQGTSYYLCMCVYDMCVYMCVYDEHAGVLTAKIRTNCAHVYHSVLQTEKARGEVKGRVHIQFLLLCVNAL